MYSYNILINYNENDTEYLKKYNLNIDNEIFTQVYQVKFPNLFKKGDIIRIDNFINGLNNFHIKDVVMAKVEDLEFDLWIDCASEETGIDINLSLEII